MRAHREQQPTVVVGRVRKPHGVRGAVVVDPLTDVEGRFVPGASLLLRLPEGALRDVRVAAVRGDAAALIVTFAGIENRDAVEPLRGALLEVDRRWVPEPPAGAFYEYQLAGCRLVDRSAGELGEILELVEDGGGWLLEVGRGDARLLVPFVERYVKGIDLEARRIDVALPEGLIELCTSTS